MLIYARDRKKKHKKKQRKHGNLLGVSFIEIYAHGYSVINHIYTINLSYR